MKAKTIAKAKISWRQRRKKGFGTMKEAAKNVSDTGKHNIDINNLILCGVFAAVVAVCSWITVPLPFTQVPINLAILGVLIAGGCLGPKYGCISLCVYILLGAAGLPVFAGLGAGLGVIVGPTGGYIVGYLLCAAICGLGANRPKGSASQAHVGAPSDVCAGSASPASPASSASSATSAKPRAARLIFFMALGVLACYAFGTVWYVFLMKTSLWVGLVSCVFPFIPLDAIKIAAAAPLVMRLQKIIK